MNQVVSRRTIQATWQSFNPQLFTLHASVTDTIMSVCVCMHTCWYNSHCLILICTRKGNIQAFIHRIKTSTRMECMVVSQCIWGKHYKITRRFEYKCIVMSTIIPSLIQLKAQCNFHVNNTNIDNFSKLWMHFIM